MKIGRETVPRTSICTSDESTILVRGRNLAQDIIGHKNFTSYFHLLLTGRELAPAQLPVLDAALVAIAEHGFVPSIQAARMTYAAAPECLQGAVAAGLLGCGSVILGAAEDAGRLLLEVRERAGTAGDFDGAAERVVGARREAGMRLPGYGHPEHKTVDPRVQALFTVAHEAGESACDRTFMRAAEAIERAIPQAYGKPLRLNVSAAIPAVLLGIGFPVAAMKGVPLLARTASLIAHLFEEMHTPSGFALSYQATREMEYADGTGGPQ